MATPVVFYFDPLCPWCFQTSRWMHRVEELGRASIEWGFFSLIIGNSEGGVDTVDPTNERLWPLRVAVAVREKYGNAAVGRFYQVVATRHWEGLEDYSVATFEAALTDVGLDPAVASAAVTDHSTWEILSREHAELVAATQSFGVPTIRFGGPDAPAIFGPVVSEIPSDEDAIALFDHVAWLATYPNFAELKRERIVELDTERSRQWAVKRAAKQAAETAAEAS
jgi:hypothetical protein